MEGTSEAANHYGWLRDNITMKKVLLVHRHSLWLDFPRVVIEITF